jgi:hypothetical protein
MREYKSAITALQDPARHVYTYRQATLMRRWKIYTETPVPNGTVLERGSLHTLSVRMTELTPQLFLAVPCPTCGVDAGKDCVLNEGGLRSDPHIDRKLDAAEAIEAKRTPNPG